jgi:hypothetical protein
MLRLIKPKYNNHISKIKITNESLYAFHKSNQLMQTRNAFTINAAITAGVKWVLHKYYIDFLQIIIVFR